MRDVLFRINGAAMLRDIKVHGECYELPEVSEEYTHGAMYEGLLLASRDGEDYGLAAVVKLGNNLFTAENIKTVLQYHLH